MELKPWFTKAEHYFYNLFSSWEGDFDCLGFIVSLSKKYGDDNVISAIKEWEWLVESVRPINFNGKAMEFLLVHIKETLIEKLGWLS